MSAEKEKEKADLGFGAAVDDFNPDEWAPKKKTANDRPSKEVTEKVAASSGFVSREPKKRAAPKSGAGEGELVRRRRTGRNVQFNMRTTQDAIDRFVAIADRQGWVLGETLEEAVELLEAKYGKGKQGFGKSENAR